jgi:pimeloyl-ACP methyl ester carboxylesterase
MKSRSCLAAAALVLFWNLCAWHGPNTLDDRTVTIHTARDAEAKRAELIRYLWGKKGFPEKALPEVVPDIPTPVKGLTNLARVDALRFPLSRSVEGLSYHFVPRHSIGELVVVHQGHLCSLDADASEESVGRGLSRTIEALLREGYGVLAVFMPGNRPGDCTRGHASLFRIRTAGSPMKFFLEPTAISLHYIKTQARRDHFPEYRAFHMIGFSGGGWTTTLYAALDPTIRCSFSVAGSMPLYLRSRRGDREQSDVGFYGLAGYPDLYVLGGFGAGREQVQILNRRDDCCFGEAEYDAQALNVGYEDAVRSYEEQVRAALAEAGSGAFRLEIDETATRHMISLHTVEDVIVPELHKSCSSIRLASR